MPNVPKPLHGMAPRVLLSPFWWAVTKQNAYASTGYRCAACWVPKSEAKYHSWLEAHEVYDVDYAAGTATYIETVPLCHSCHNFIHSGRMESLVQNGEMPASKYKDIIRHGRSILKKAGLKMPKEPKNVARWESWAMVIDGKKYPTVYKDYEEWKEKYAESEQP